MVNRGSPGGPPSWVWLPVARTNLRGRGRVVASSLQNVTARPKCQKASQAEDICFSSLRGSSEVPQAAEEICGTFEASEIVVACTMRSAGLCSCQVCVSVGARMEA